MSRSYSLNRSHEPAKPSETVADELRVYADRDAEKFEQIQELLVGDTRRDLLARIAELESRIKSIETSVVRRLESLETRISEVSFRSEENQKRTIDEVSRSMGELSERLKGVSR